MLDPERHDLPEIVLSLLACIEATMEETGAPDPVLGSKQLTGQILRQWGAIQVFVTAPGSKVTSRFIEEIRIWCEQTARAIGAEEEHAAEIARRVAAAINLTFAGTVLYLPRDRWTYRAELSRRFDGHNLVELCREYRIGSATLYRIVFEERNGGPKIKNKAC